MRPSSRLLCRAFICAIFIASLDGLAAQTDEGLPRWEARLLARYQGKLDTLLADADAGCIDCHSDESASPLVLSGNALQDLRFLLDNGYLKHEGPDSLLGRIRSDNAEKRMPKDGERWNKNQVRRLERFIDLVARQQKTTGSAADEQFPRSLLTPFENRGEAPPVPNQFLTYRQLKAKVWAIFQDDWKRGERDLFAENVGAFGGADFVTRFNESAEPSAAYLSTLEVLARDVASRAFRRRGGPFSDWVEPTEPDLSADTWVEAIERLYSRMLFRAPTQDEVTASINLLRSVHDLDQTISGRDTELVFELSVTDPETGLSATQTVTLPVRGDRVGVRQAVLDQGLHQVDPDRWLERLATSLTHKVASRAFGVEFDSAPGRQSLGRIRLGPKQPGRVVIHNQATRRNVSFAGIDIRSPDGETVLSIDADSPDVDVEGAWTLQKREGRQILEDGNQHKGNSTITIPLTAEQEGEYEIIVRWHPAPENARNVLVELYGVIDDSRLEAAQLVIPPLPATARFHYDCGNDSIPYFEIPGSFQFNPEDYVEISNRGTHKRVTAGAIELVNAVDPANNFLIDSKFARGAEQWEKYKEGTFGAYNVRGEKLHDENRRKGQLTLQYLLEDRVDDGWREDQFYKVRIYYPGKVNHEPMVPVTVLARRSSPIVQVSHPLVAKSDAVVRLDALKSYTVQESELDFRWRQVAGPPVDVKDWASPVIEFQAPRQSSRELAWVSLCSALMRHPDFLFTQPPSLQSADGRDSIRLQKLAMDLVGRPPTQADFDRLNAGQPLTALVDDYLQSEEFRDFYFHRVRLYLESQGSELEDEPARLWCYVAFHDRPFQEILTADYTVNARFEKVARPAHHGKTGVLTTKGFIAGKPGLPHYNYAAQVSMLFLGYVYEVPPEVLQQREGVTAMGTTDPNSTCYSCHKILTPLAFQRLNWTDAGEFRDRDETGLEIDASDRGAVDEYPFKGTGLEAFATQAVKKERFIRSIINTHVDFYFGRPMRYLGDERDLYRRLWDNVHENDFQLRALIKAIVTSPEYLGQLATGDASNENDLAAQSSDQRGDP